MRPREHLPFEPVVEPLVQVTPTGPKGGIGTALVVFELGLTDEVRDEVGLGFEVWDDGVADGG